MLRVREIQSFNLQAVRVLRGWSLAIVLYAVSVAGYGISGYDQVCCIYRNVPLYVTLLTFLHY